MQPRGPLMIEHRLIERMISSINKEIIQIEKSGIVNQTFIAVAVDFIQIYADRTHHGKEEEILFRDLAKKKLTVVDKRIMNELIQEHVFGRTTTAQLVTLADAYRKGDKTTLPLITQTLRKFIDFYPKHIEKEDTVFFPAAMAYFPEQEQKAMLDEFREFDGKMIHEKYKCVIKSIDHQEATL
jgi:hemerythrin-like domain-containing protein